MAHHFATEIPPRLSMWQRVREYAVPPSMIEEAAARRAVGDWAGACAAARVYVDLDLRAVRDRHGTDLTARLRQDLRRLAPDLLRWHMPRSAPDGRLRPGLTLTLARYRRPGGAPLHLVVRTPPARADGGQHMSLALWEGPGSGSPGRHPHPHPHPERRFRLDLHRHLWDADRVGELAWRCGVDGIRSRSAPDAGHPPDDPFPADATEGRVGLDSCWAVGRWAAEAELLLRAEGLPRGVFTVRLGSRSRTVLELVAPDDSHVPALRPLPEDALPPHEVAVLPVLPEAAARVLPDLELLRAGLVPAERLHPLLVDVLAPNGSASVGSSPRPPGDPHRVECRGEVHRITLRDGVLTAVDHDRDQLRREEMLVALGGPPLPCLRAIDAVHRAPEALPAVRERLGHGDVTGAFAVLEGLLGPGAILRDGPLRDELDSAMARRLEHGLFRSGLQSSHLAAGDAGSDGIPGARRARSDHRPRLERRTPPSVRHKLSSRSRPRIGLLP